MKKRYSVWVAISASTLLFVSTLFFYERLGRLLLKYLGPATRMGTYVFLKALGLKVSGGVRGPLNLPLTLPLTLEVPPLSPRCIHGNSIGLFGMGLFISVFLFLSLRSKTDFSFKKSIPILLLGLLSMFILNMVRLALTIAADFRIQKIWGEAESGKLYRQLVDTHFGWSFYAVVLVVCLGFLNWINQNSRKTIT